MSKFYITTPIYYVNDKPHIGHAYTTIVADALARYHRSLGEDVVFLTGTDENSQKTVDAANKLGEDPKIYIERLAGIWKSVWSELDISNTDFIRTTEDRHIKVVNEIWNRVVEAGDIYKGKYDGLYCRGHEAFMKESDLVDGLCPDHKTAPEHIIEENYFFKLSKYQKDILKFYEENPNFISPDARFNELKSFVEGGLEDISISREKQGWGIPVPGDSSHAIYVWFDALINYISGVGIEEWISHPADIHALGKDIIRFHGVIWPAMLMSAKLPLPKKLISNGFFTVDGVKISKSLGNAIDPIELKKKYGTDAIRYFLLREISYGKDGDFSYDKLHERYTADLANGLGNFASRVLAMGVALETIKKDVIGEDVSRAILDAKNGFKNWIEEVRFGDAISEIWKLIQFGDTYINTAKPWAEEDQEKKEKTIYNLVSILEEIALLVSPILPESAEKIKNCIENSAEGVRVKKIEPLFPRVG